MRKIALLIAFVLLVPFALGPARADSTAGVLISEVYGGGGNTSATYDHDFVELHNRSRSNVDVTNWRVEYSSASSSTWSGVTLRGAIAATHYFLVKLGSGGTNGKALPPADTTGATNIARSEGKIRLRTPAGTVVDLVGYGSANLAEGKPASGATTNTVSLNRLRQGCNDTDANDKDFRLAAPNPKYHADHTYCGATPVLAPIGSKTVVASDTLRFDVSATDADHDPLTYSAAPLPAGATFATGTFTWKPKDADVGTHNVTFTVSDGFAKDSEPITITVKPDPLAGKTAISLEVTQQTRTITVSGQVSPNEAGKTVHLALFRYERPHYRRLETKQVVLNSTSSYAAAFHRPTPGKCLIRARFDGDAERSGSEAEWSDAC